MSFLSLSATVWDISDIFKETFFGTDKLFLKAFQGYYGWFVQKHALIFNIFLLLLRLKLTLRKSSCIDNSGVFKTEILSYDIRHDNWFHNMVIYEVYIDFRICNISEQIQALGIPRKYRAVRCSLLLSY